MSYKVDLTQARDFITESQKNEKEAKIVYKDGPTYKEVKEFMAYIVAIYPGKDGKMAQFKLRFANGETANTFFYLSNKMEEGQIISVIGYFIKGPYGLEFKARGGANPLITNAKELGSFNTVFTHRMGIVTGLSKVKMPEVYSDNENLVPIEDTNFYYLIRDIEVETEEEFELDENSADVRHTNYINTNMYGSDTAEVEDFIDVEDEPTSAE